MLTSSVSLIAKTQGWQLHRRDERWVRGTLTLDSQGFRVDLVETNQQNLRKLLARRIDLWATSSTVLQSVITDPELKDRMQVLATVREVHVFLACSLQTSAETVARLRAASAQIEADGTAAQLARRFPR